MMTLADRVAKLEKERNYYRDIARAYKALKGKTLETAPESCKRDFERRMDIIKGWESDEYDD